MALSYCKEEKIKKIFAAGLVTFFLVGTVVFLLKMLVVDILPSVFGPLILPIFGKENLVVPLSVVFTVFLIFLFGFLTIRVDFRKIVNKTLLKKGLKYKQGALYKDDFAAIIKEIRYRRNDGQILKKYVVYRPFAPLPQSGFLSIAEEREVIPLKISYLELYSIVASFGKNTPELLEELEELKNQSAD